MLQETGLDETSWIHVAGEGNESAHLSVIIMFQVLASDLPGLADASLFCQQSSTFDNPAD
jgi:hypothetical protein